jgi:hypothetical protein
MPSPSTFSRVPMGTGAPARFQQPSTVAAASSVSYLSTTAMLAPDSCASSCATAAKISSGAAALATSVATRCSAACSPASRSASWRPAPSAGHDELSTAGDRQNRVAVSRYDCIRLPSTLRIPTLPG